MDYQEKQEEEWPTRRSDKSKVQINPNIEV